MYYFVLGLSSSKWTVFSHIDPDPIFYEIREKYLTKNGDFSEWNEIKNKRDCDFNTQREAISILKSRYKVKKMNPEPQHYKCDKFFVGVEDC